MPGPQVVLLRGINVGRGNRLPMSVLSAELAGLGCRDVRTVLQSGNAVVSGGEDLAVRLPAALLARTGLRLAVFVRSGPELVALAAANPFPHLVPTPRQLHLVLLAGPPDPAAAGTYGADELRAGDRALYASYAGSSHDSPLAPVLQRLAPVSTARNWATVARLLALVGG